MRSHFFGKNASTKKVGRELEKKYKNYELVDCDIRDKREIGFLFRRVSLKNIKAIIHTAAQPSHDWAAKDPMMDWDINANGTMVLLEAFRNNCPEASFIFTSTNKVYGDTPNNLNFIEHEKRYECCEIGVVLHSISEKMSIDNSIHSVFGASKVAADVMVQEYGKYFGLNTVCFRGGCLTGPRHQGAELHGFLSYLIKQMVHNGDYTVFGYKGKQVRDNIHSYDLVNAFWYYIQSPSPGEVYNMGGGRGNDVSILEVIDYVNDKLETNWEPNFSAKARIGDHRWYVSNLRKFKTHYPNWNITISVFDIIDEIIEMELAKCS
jgi:CDP-paratose 2-epimerase